MGIGPIPWTAVVEYADRHGYDEELQYRFVAGIREMDDVFIEKSNETTDG